MIILGSSSDIHIAEKSMDILEKLEIPYSLKIASAHRTPNLIREIVKKGTDAGIEVFIGIAGLAAHLPGAIAAYTPRPVIGVPVDVKTGGIDALDSCVHMPYPSPIATVGIDRGDNGAILAAQFMGIHDSEIREKVINLRKEYQTKVYDSNKIVDEIKDKKFLVKDYLNVENLLIENVKNGVCKLTFPIAHDLEFYKNSSFVKKIGGLDIIINGELLYENKKNN